MYGRIFVILAAMIAPFPFGAKAADLVVWWEEGFNSEEEDALREIIAAFEQQTIKQVEFALYPQAELQERIDAALEPGQPRISPSV